MNKFFYFLALLLFVLVSCNSQRNMRLIVASEQADCVGVVPQKCYMIKSEGENSWKYLYNQIEGFTYQPGYEYVLEVRTETVKLPAADQSSIRYILVKEVSRVKK